MLCSTRVHTKPFSPKRTESRQARAVRASAANEGNPSLMSSLLAGMMVLSTTMPPAVLADEMDNLTPYERRQLEQERRRDLLRQARAKAEQATAEKAAAEKAEATAQADQDVESSNELRRASTVRKLSVDAYEQQAAKSFKLPTPAPAPAAAPEEAPKEVKLPDFGGFKFEMPKLEMPEMPAPEPAKPAPAPTPAPAAEPRRFSAPVPVPVPVPAPTPVFTPPPPPPAPKVEAPKKVVEAAKPAPEAQKPGKRKGPLPLAVAELVVLGMMAGVAVAFTKYERETNSALAASWKLISSLYSQVEAATAKK